MSRARNIKPSFFTNDVLAECEPIARLLFAGLWTIADREGRLEDRPKKIKAEVLPYDDCNAGELLDQLSKHNFILRYEIDGEKYIQIRNFTKHQNPHHMEIPSAIPPADGFDDKYSHSPIGVPQRRRIYERDKHKCRLCNSKDRLHIDHIIPVSKGGSSEDDNLQTLCHDCNTSKGNRNDISLTRKEQIKNKMTSSQSHDDDIASHPTDSPILIPDPPYPLPDSSSLRSGVRAKKIALDELSVDHNAEWLAKKRCEGRYIHHDEYFILEQFKQYCSSKGKKYADYLNAYRNSFEWEKCQPKPNGNGSAPGGIGPSAWTTAAEQIIAEDRATGRWKGR